MNLLDSHALSELTSSSPDARVPAWLQAQPMAELPTLR
jgi:predicted nucleic acid-binding protein